jgi:membrane fusion protein (multidrug efflux system)
VKQARIRLGYTRIHSPIDGRIGISAARVGEFVGRHPNPVVLNYVSRTDPIRVRFSVDERTYLSLARRRRELRKANGEEPGLGQGLRLTLADGTEHPYPGAIVAADAAVDPKTGTYTLEADFPNPDSEAVVVAGQFARVRAVIDVVRDALLVPSRAVSELQGSFRVYVIGEDGTVELRPVELGPVVDNLRIIRQGVRAGERVAVEIMRLRPGMKVEPRLVPLAEDGTILEPDDDSGAPSAAPEGDDEPGDEAKAT